LSDKIARRKMKLGKTWSGLAAAMGPQISPIYATAALVRGCSGHRARTGEVPFFTRKLTSARLPHFVRRRASQMGQMLLTKGLRLRRLQLPPRAAPPEARAQLAAAVGA
jgi:hypothetical protein